MLIFDHTSRHHLGSIAHTKCILFEIPKLTLNFKIWLLVVLSFACFCTHKVLPPIKFLVQKPYIQAHVVYCHCGKLFTDCVCLALPPQQLILSRKASRHHWKIVTKRLCLEKYRGYCLGQCQYKFYFRIHLRFVAPHLFPIHSYELEITIIMCHNNSVPIILNQLHICHVYFWSVHYHNQTCQSTINLLLHYILLCRDFQLCLFNAVMTTAPWWRIQNIYAHSMALRPKMHIFLVSQLSPPPSVYLASS